LKVYFACYPGTDSVEFRNILLNQTPNEAGIFDDIELCYSKDEADFIIVMDKTNEKIDDYSNVIFFGREPWCVERNMPTRTDYFGVYHHEVCNSWLPSLWWVGKNYSELLTLKSPEKNKNVSLIDSGKNFTIGHSIRVALVEKISKMFMNSIDIFGKTTVGRENVSPFMYPLPARKKDDGLLDYKFNIAIENCSTECYFSEKFVDPLLCWTVPIYWGCKNISKFFPAGSFISIDPTGKNACEKIIEISQSDFREKNLSAIQEARELILNKYNVFPTVQTAISKRYLFKSDLLDSIERETLPHG